MHCTDSLFLLGKKKKKMYKVSSVTLTCTTYEFHRQANGLKGCTVWGQSNKILSLFKFCVDSFYICCVGRFTLL